MGLLRLQAGRMGIAAPKSTGWKIAAVIASLPILLLVIVPTLIGWLSGASPDLYETAGGLAALILIFLPTWIALFLNHRHALLIFLSNLFWISVAGLSAAGISVLSWAGLGEEAWWGILGWQVALIWSFIEGKRPDAPEMDHSPPPIPSLTTINP